MRAAAQRRLDYTQRQVGDLLWLTKETLVLDELEREAWMKWEDIGRQFFIASMVAPISDENQAQIKEAVLDQLNRAGKALLPWAKWAVTKEEKRQAKEDAAQSARQRWENAFGRLDSTRVREAERRAKLYLLANVLRKRARTENRQMTEAQGNWLRDITQAMQGNRGAWRRASTYSTADLLHLFSQTFHRRAVAADIRSELGEIV